MELGQVFPGPAREGALKAAHRQSVEAGRRWSQSSIHAPYKRLNESYLDASLQKGVSLKYLVESFIPDVLDALKKTDVDGMDFYTLEQTFWKQGNPSGFKASQRIICPRDDRLGCAIVDALQPPDSGKATHFLSWCWGYLVKDFVSALEGWARRNGFSEENTFMWICFFCNNQRQILIEGRGVGSDDLAETFASKLKAIGRVVVLLDTYHSPLYTKRAWTVYEIFVASLAMERGDVTEIEMVLPHRSLAAMLDERLSELKSKLGNVHVENSHASSSKDLTRIKTEIQQSCGGFNEVNTKVKEFLIQMVGTVLREESFIKPLSSKTTRYRDDDDQLDSFDRLQGGGEKHRTAWTATKPALITVVMIAVFVAICSILFYLIGHASAKMRAPADDPSRTPVDDSTQEYKLCQGWGLATKVQQDMLAWLNCGIIIRVAQSSESMMSTLSKWVVNEGPDGKLNVSFLGSVDQVCKTDGDPLKLSPDGNDVICNNYGNGHAFAWVRCEDDFSSCKIIQGRLPSMRDFDTVYHAAFLSNGTLALVWCSKARKQTWLALLDDPLPKDSQRLRSPPDPGARVHQLQSLHGHQLYIIHRVLVSTSPPHIVAVAYSCFGSFLTLRLYNLDGSLLQSLELGRGWKLITMAWSSDGERLATCGDTCIVWTRIGSQNTWAAFGQPFRGHNKRVSAVSWSPEGNILATGSKDQSIILWSAGPDGMIRYKKPVTNFSSTVKSLIWSPNGRWLLVSDEHGWMSVWGASCDMAQTPFLHTL